MTPGYYEPDRFEFNHLTEMQTIKRHSIALLAALLASVHTAPSAFASDVVYPREFTYLDDHAVAAICARTLFSSGFSILGDGSNVTEEGRQFGLIAFTQGGVWAADLSGTSVDRAMVDRVIAKLDTAAPHREVFDYCIRKSESKFKGMSPGKQREIKEKAEARLQSSIKR